MRRIVGVFQRLVVRLGYLYPGPMNGGKRISWVVGPNEVARMVSQIADVIPDSYTALIVRHPFYSETYDYQPPPEETALRALWRRIVLNAWTFGRLARHATGFIYLSQNGYLNDQFDHRRFEFSFLKRRGLKIVCYFTGSDIRSPKLMRQHEEKTGLPNIASYLKFSDPAFGTDAFEESRRSIGETADEFADAIFTARVEQAGYITSKTESFLYFLPDEDISESLQKFDRMETPVVLHAPSSPVIKGTQLVRAAVKALQQSGFEFEYVELVGVPHEQVQEQLRRAHVVLNQFYAHMPGMFGVEALASGCVVLMSADEHIEADLPSGSNDAWVVTKHWQVYSHLREVLAHPQRMREQARAGQDWVRRHATASVSADRLTQLLNRLEADS